MNFFRMLGAAGGRLMRAAVRAAVGIFTNLVEDTWGLLRGVNPIGRGDPPDLGTQNMLEIYENNARVHAVISRIAYSEVSTPFFIRAILPRGKKGHFIRCPDLQMAPLEIRKKEIAKLEREGRVRSFGVVGDIPHPMIDALNAPNPLHTGFEARTLIRIFIETTGDAFLLKRRNKAGVTCGFWPVPPHWVIAQPTPSAPEYLVQFRHWHGTIPETEILWLHRPGPVNPYTRGAGVVRALGDDIEVDLYASKHAKQLFFNRARPDFVVQVDGAEPDIVDSMEMDWNARLQGYWRAQKPMFINRKLDIHEFQAQNLSDLAMLPIKQFERDEILAGWGFPPELLGLVKNSNRATIQTAEHLFNVGILKPRLEWLRCVLQVRLMPEYDDRGIVDFEDPVREDDDFDLSVMKAAPQAYRVDEWRAKTNSLPLGGALGSAFYVPLNGYLTPDPLDLSTRPTSAPPPTTAGGTESIGGGA